MRRSQLLESRASAMRSLPTASEARLFEAVRCGKLGVSFRRQVPLAGRFIADLYASKVRLVVEIDGAYHAKRKAADERRDSALAKLGIHVLRLSAELVTNDLDAAVEHVRLAIERRLAHFASP